MKLKVTYATNFLRVFRVPEEFSEQYCFGGTENASEFFIIDWFNAFSTEKFQKVETVIDIETTDRDYIEHIEIIKKFIRGKKYFKQKDCTVLVMTDYGDVFIVNPDRRPAQLEKQMAELTTRAKKEIEKKEKIIEKAGNNDNKL